MPSNQYALYARLKQQLNTKPKNIFTELIMCDYKSEFQLFFKSNRPTKFPKQLGQLRGIGYFY